MSASSFALPLKLLNPGKVAYLSKTCCRISKMFTIVMKVLDSHCQF
jgi:hypothetical protein